MTSIIAQAREALGLMLPDNFNVSNANLPDSAIVPIDITLGDLRRAKTIFDQLQDSSGGGGEVEHGELTTAQQLEVFGNDLVDLLRREAAHSNVWFKTQLLQAANVCEIAGLKALTPSSDVSGDGWLPIESAPKDGTIVLLWCPDGVDRLGASPNAAEKYTLGFFGNGNGFRDEWHSVESREEMWGMGSEYTGPMFETECLTCKPTHWRPLPAPPTNSLNDDSRGTGL